MWHWGLTWCYIVLRNNYVTAQSQIGWTFKFKANVSYCL